MNMIFKPVSAATLALWGAVVLFLSGCGGPPAPVVERQFVAYTQEEQARLADQRGRFYRIQENDILDVAFSYQKELNQTDVVVLPDGSVTLAGVDRVVVAGLTVVEADSLITAAYARDYRDPDLSVIVAKTKGRQVYVMGEVKEPGLYSLPYGGLDVLGAISIAGGFSESASKDNTAVVRVEPTGYRVTRFDLDHFDEATQRQLGLERLEPYDIVYVPRSGTGSFAYFNKTVLTGIAQVARIAADAKYLSGSTNVRY